MSEVSTIDGESYIPDGFPQWGENAQDLTDNERNLVHTLIQNSLVVIAGLTYYIYSTSLAAWVQMYSKLGSVDLLKITGIKALVN